MMTDVPEMVEQVALALYLLDGVPPPWTEDAAIRQTYVRAARAAIEAMREPTEAMLDAGKRTDVAGTEHREGIAACWRAMIIEALR
jgi:hypothetical protein